MDLITGATGFIGGRLAKQLANEGSPSRVLTRNGSSTFPSPYIANLYDQSALIPACRNIETVYHCAGCADAFNTLSQHDTEEIWATNFIATDNLAKIAGQTGVRKFIFLSSIKAIPEAENRCVDESYSGVPLSPYGQSKRAAEEAILKTGYRYGMHVVILRLVMVYGSGGRGNLERMGRFVRKGIFPPPPETGNHRSLVHVDDVISAMRLVAFDERANGRTYIITGPEAPSGRQLYDAMRHLLALPTCPWSVPEPIFRGMARCGDAIQMLLKKRFPLNTEAVNRLLCSSWYSSERITQELGWRPKVSLSEGLREMFGC